jgi:hypothetical protein
LGSIRTGFADWRVTPFGLASRPLSHWQLAGVAEAQSDWPIDRSASAAFAQSASAAALPPPAFAQHVQYFRQSPVSEVQVGVTSLEESPALPSLAPLLLPPEPPPPDEEHAAPQPTKPANERAKSAGATE